MRVLGIETSCDETGIAIYDSERGLLAHRLFSQVAMHADYGGVVPELASRDHVRKTIPLIRELMQEADTSAKEIHGIAFTKGPGLVGALLVGAAIGQSLAFAWNVPAIGVHHMEGHLLAPMLEPDPPEFPFLALLVSGGHTQLVKVSAVGEYELLGESLDDAAGEAFDKVAKMMGLEYPGGPQVAKLAEKGRPDAFAFPRPMTDRPGLDFSFSGLKTFCMNTLNQQPISARADIAASFQEAVVDTLAIKCKRALKQTNLNRVVIAGGVSANTRLRSKLEAALATINARVFYARPEFCTDNGAMIAYAGWRRLCAGQQEDLTIKAVARWPLDSLPSL